MSEQNPSKADLQRDLDKAEIRATELEDERDEAVAALENTQADMDTRLARMEALIAEQQAAGEYAGPEPEMYHDPYDISNNPMRILSHPEGKRLGWKNPRLRDEDGWLGWEPLTWESEIGRDIDKYIASPPAKLEGISKQDNYIRRGTDAILSILDEDIWKARQQKREAKALRKQLAANARAKLPGIPGVAEVIGEGVQADPVPPGGFKTHGAVRTGPAPGRRGTGSIDRVRGRTTPNSCPAPLSSACSPVVHTAPVQSPKHPPTPAHPRGLSTPVDWRNLPRVERDTTTHRSGPR